MIFYTEEKGKRNEKNKKDKGMEKKEKEEEKNEDKDKESETQKDEEYIFRISPFGYLQVIVSYTSPRTFLQILMIVYYQQLHLLFSKEIKICNLLIIKHFSTIGINVLYT